MIIIMMIEDVNRIEYKRKQKMLICLKMLLRFGQCDTSERIKKLVGTATRTGKQ